MYCSKCGHKNQTSAKFCGGCGQKLIQQQNRWLLPLILTCLLVLGGSVFGIGYLTEWNFATLFNQSANQSTAPSERENKSEKKTNVQLIKDTLPRVFTIYTPSGSGSGFLYKQGGYIVTNAHVVAGYVDVVIRNSDGKDTAGKVIGISNVSDIALIRAPHYDKATPLQTEHQETPIGTEVIALGSPQGYENSASIGYVTGLNRDIELGFLYEKIYQIDAQIDQGSSGGPLIDAETGKVIGINSLIHKKNTLFGFAIPMHSVTSLLEQWVHSPMSEDAVASVFGIYEEDTADYYEYEEEYYDEYEDFYEDYADPYEENYYYDDSEDEYMYDTIYEELNYYLNDFRAMYQVALDTKDFSHIESYLAPNSSAYDEFSSYIHSIRNEPIEYTFLYNVVTDYSINDPEGFQIWSYESYILFDKYGNAKEIEKEKHYWLLVDDYGDLVITDVELLN